MKNTFTETEDSFIINSSSSKTEATSSGVQINIKISPKKGFFARLIDTYDITFLIALGLQYFNNGLKSIVALAYMNIFKNYYNL